MSEEAELPHDTPSSAGNKIVSGAALELELETAGVLEEENEEEEEEEEEEALETPSWKTDSDIWILLGV